MKKALEAGIKYCDNIRQKNYLSYSENYIYSIHKVLEIMLAAIDEEPEKVDLDKIGNIPQTILSREPEPFINKSHFKMKDRPKYFLADDKISHDSEVFDYIRELHDILWEIVGHTSIDLGDAIENYMNGKPEPQGRVVDYKKLEKIIVNLSYCTYEKIIEGLKECESQWLKTKPAIDPEIKDKYYELLYAVENKFPEETRHETALRYIKRAEGDGIDPEIKKVYDHWKKNDGIVVIERAFEREMWNCIKAHCERGE